MKLITEREFNFILKDDETESLFYYVKTLEKEDEKTADRIAKEFIEEHKILPLYELVKDKERIVKKINSLIEKHKVKEELKDSMLTEVLMRVSDAMRLAPLMLDPGIEDIQVMGYDKEVVIAHNEFGVCTTNISFSKKNNELRKLLERIIRDQQVHISFSNPIIDVSLSDGSRLNATIEPISPNGPMLTIRKFSAKPITIISLVKKGQLTHDAAALLWLYMDAFQAVPINLIIAGGVGSGKTTFTNALTLFIPEEEVLLTIEDTQELQPQTKNVIRLISRPPSFEGTGEISQDVLLKASLRKNPDRIIIGEMRGKEAASLFTAMNIGRKCLTTIHANRSEEVIKRLTSPPMNVPIELIGLLDVIIMMVRINEGDRIKRRVFQISELIDKGDSQYEINNVYEWNPKTDCLEKKNEPVKVKEIAEFLGVDEGLIKEDLKNREKIIRMLSEEEKNIEEMRKVIEKYHRTVIRFIRKKSLQ